MLEAILAAALVALSVGEPHSVKVDDNTEVRLTLREDALQIVWNCMENNMEYVNSFYQSPQWKVWEGEAVDCTFSPFAWEKNPTQIGFPSYRQVTNPSNYCFSFVHGKRLMSVSFTSKTVRSEKDWTVEWIIPFAGLETSEYPDADSDKIFPPGSTWGFKFSRRSETSGTKTQVTTPVILIQFSKEVIEPYRQIMLTNYKGTTTDKTGIYRITGTLHNTSDKEFTGKAKLFLLADKDVSVLKEIDVKLPAGGTMQIDEPVTMPELAARFHIRTVIEDQSGLPVRISYDLPIKNPWVEF